MKKIILDVMYQYVAKHYGMDEAHEQYYDLVQMADAIDKAIQQHANGIEKF